MLELIPKQVKKMEMALLILSVILIALVLLQGNKASDAGAGQIISGGNTELFQAQKERGIELFISRLTFVIGAAFMILSFLIMFTA